MNKQETLSETKNGKFAIFYYICLFLLGLTVVILAEVFIFKAGANSLAFKENIETSKIFSLLATFWFIAFLLESLLEVLIKIFQIKPSTVESFTAIAGLGIALIIAFAGVSTLGEFFTITPDTPRIEGKLFQAIDTILTAGVIAGGSKGIHKLTSAYRDILEAIKQRAGNTFSSLPDGSSGR